MTTSQQSKARTAQAAPSETTGVDKNGKGKASKPTLREQIVLFAIGYQERYGLEIQRAVKECSGGTESISIGSLYPTLHSLEQKGLVSSRFGEEVVEERGGARRRYYSLTSDGLSCIQAIQQYQSELLTWQST
ncbi:PadR family transcriptional regulator [Nodosilinea nodulosa]|uniref:PadR family transcriptional regulator n=1 Tax=Nodosilinea nodulosa TaxID=416001 RepID=UPI0009FD09F3|nr:PadR family transcriptional regulator [Nodosilinea nodulosa]